MNRQGRVVLQMAGAPSPQQSARSLDPARDRRAHMAWSLGLALLAFAVRAPGLFAGFVFDDAFGMQQRTGADWSRIPAYFTSDQSAFFGSNFYRPVLNFFCELVYSTGGAHAAAWHAASILLHVACVLLVFRLALRVIEDQFPPQHANYRRAGDPFAAWLAAALFAVHPTHVEAIAWASAIAEPLWTLFLLLSVLAFLHWMERGGAAWWIGWFVAGAAAIFTKETAVVVPFVLLATALALRPRSKPLMSTVAATLPLFAAAAIFLTLRQTVLHSFSHPLTVATTAQMLFTWPAALLFYLEHMFWPSVVVPFYPLQIVKSWQSPEFFVPLIELVAALAALGWLLWRAAGRRRALLCAVWTFAPLAPALYLKALAPFELVHDRFLYAPLVGFCMAAALALQWAAERIEVKSQAVSSRRVLAIAAIALLPLLGIESMSQMLWWQNNKTLFARALTVTPENPKALANLAGVYMAEHHEAEAAPLLRHAMEIAPHDSIVLYGMARLAWLRGEDATAEQFMIGALRTTSRYDMWLQLAVIELRLNKMNVAENAAMQAAKMNPNGQGVHAAMGTILLAKGDRQQAVREFEQELRHYPRSEAARAGMARANGSLPR